MKKSGGPRIRLTAWKRVPQIFKKFTWNSAQAKSASPSTIRDSTSEKSPIRAPDPRGIQAQAHDLVHGDWPRRSTHAARVSLHSRHATQPEAI
jgi:hypothetical protein